MAKQGNYVTVSGGSGANPFKGLSDSLADLSKMYTGRDTVDREEALKRAELAATTEQRNFTNKIAQANADRLANEDARQKLIRKASHTAPTFGLDAYGPQARKGRELLVANKERELPAIENYFDVSPTITNDAELNAQNTVNELTNLDNAVNVYKDSLERSGVHSADKIPELARQRKFKLLEYRQMLGDAKTPEEQQKLRNTFIEELYDKPVHEYDKNVAKGLGLTLEQQKDSVLNQIPEEFKGQLSTQEYLAAVAPHITGRTKQSIQDSETARIEADRKRQKEDMDAANTYYQRANSGRYTNKNSSAGQGSKGAISALQTLGEVEDTVTSWFPGDDDKSKVRAGFQHLLNLKTENGKKISPQLAAAAIDYGKENNLFADDFPDLGSPEFAEIQYMAELMASGSSSKGSFTRPQRSEFRYRDVGARTVDDILFQELAGRTPLRGKIPVNEAFSRDLLNYTKRKPLIRTPAIPGGVGVGGSGKKVELDGLTPPPPQLAIQQTAQRAIDALPVPDEVKTQIRALPKGNQNAAVKALALEAEMAPSAKYDPAAVKAFEQQQNKIEAEKQLAKKKAAYRRGPDKASPRAVKKEAEMIMGLSPEYREGALKNLKTKYGKYGAGTVAAVRQDIAKIELDPFITSTAGSVGLPPDLLRAVITTESSFDPSAVSPAGAQGLMQLMPETAEELGVKDVFDPQQNIVGGSKYLKQLLNRYDNDLDMALAAYNWGIGNLKKYGLKNAPQETRSYIQKVKRQLQS